MIMPNITFGSRLCLMLLGMALTLAASSTISIADTDATAGSRIYEHGMLPSGQPLIGMRSIGETTGADAACMSCHRASGMGSVEGKLLIPPITGNALGLNDQGTSRVYAMMDLRARRSFNPMHAPYTEKSLANAIRNNIKSNGDKMTDLMPKYDLNDEDRAALITYLENLSSEFSPGITEGEIHLATVITPDVSPEKKRIFLEVLNRKIIVKNSNTVVGQSSGRRHMVSAQEFIYGTERKWVHSIWQLQGDPSTWESQLDEYYKQEPVFAFVSGLGGETWQPISHFCERMKIPSWFPSINLPTYSESDLYTLYFNRGLALDAAVLTEYLSQHHELQPKRIRQIYKDNYLGNSSALSLRQSMKSLGIDTEDRSLPSVTKANLVQALQGLDSADALMLWLDADELSLLNQLPKTVATVYVSGRVAGAENMPLTGDWKRAVQMIYPYELPQKRQSNMDHFHQWMKTYSIKIEDEPLQAEVYFAIEYLADTFTEMLNNMYRSYLLERAESQLSINQTGKSEVRALLRKSIKPIGRETLPDLDPRFEDALQPVPKNMMGNGSTTIYPRMSLGSGQRYASKGAYIVSFEGANNNGIQKNSIKDISGWIVPSNEY